ncbi:hypothetical protein MCBRY_000827 [Methylocystis bryophila]
MSVFAGHRILILIYFLCIISISPEQFFSKFLWIIQIEEISTFWRLLPKYRDIREHYRLPHEFCLSYAESESLKFG